MPNDEHRAPDIERVIEDKLSPEQAAAARDSSREILSLACAGSGKSRTLAYRLAYLLAASEVEARSIVAFTFTEKAADTIKRRAADALRSVGRDPALLGAMYIGTIHAFCKVVLGELDARFRQYEVLDDNRLILFLISRYPELGLHHVRQDRGARYFDTVQEVAKAWKFINDELIEVADVERDDAALGRVLRTLGERMSTARFIDFSSMIRRVVEAIREGRADQSATLVRLQHLLVDEYQDVNVAQEALIDGLHGRGASLFVVGDDDQAIYTWRGADVSNILGFELRFGAAKHSLVHNYRSTDAIVTAADAFAAGELGATRLVKHPTAANPPGPRDFQRMWFDSRANEAQWVAARIHALLGTRYIERDGTARGLTAADFAILMRSTRSPERDSVPRHAAFTSALRDHGIRYSLEAGGGPFERIQVQSLLRAFGLLRERTPTRDEVRALFDDAVLTAYPNADFEQVALVMAEWGRQIHGPTEETRRRVFPQRLLHELLHAFGISRTDMPDDVMRDVALFSRMMQDVEAVYLSVDSARRFAEILNFLENVAESGYDTSTDDLVQRPDTVTVTTVHKAKGLEFPVVFVVDVEQERFPARMGNYNGWLPPNVAAAAIGRGAYRTTPFSEARLFYTAITRAERYLYVTGATRLPGGTKLWKPSQFSLRLAHPELLDTGALPAGLSPETARRRIEESDLPTSYSEIRYYLGCPRDYQFRKRFGFSPPIPELFGFGQTVHTAVGRLHQLHGTDAPSQTEAQRVAEDVFHLKHVAPSRDPENRPGPFENARVRAADIVREYAGSFSADFARQRQVEARFEVPLNGAVIAGSIDLLIRENEAGEIIDAKVIDFKSIEGGTSPQQNADLDWTALALQVQLYALGARHVLGEATRTGAVHFLKDSQRIAVPVDDDAVTAAVQNVEWAVRRIVDGDFPMRPHVEKCGRCDFQLLCPQQRQDFAVPLTPPPINVPSGLAMVRAFSQVA